MYFNFLKHDATNNKKVLNKIFCPANIQKESNFSRNELKQKSLKIRKTKLLSFNYLKNFCFVRFLIKRIKNN